MVEDFHEKLADMIENEDFAGMKKTAVVTLGSWLGIGFPSEQKGLTGINDIFCWLE